MVLLAFALGGLPALDIVFDIEVDRPLCVVLTVGGSLVIDVGIAICILVSPCR